MQKLIYCSLASKKTHLDEIKQIITKAKYNNAKFDITGFLAHGKGIFFQWLEGPEENVVNLMKLIIQDQRHFNVVILIHEKNIDQREFKDWNMAEINVKEIELLIKETLKNASLDEQKKQILSTFITKIENN